MPTTTDLEVLSHAPEPGRPERPWPLLFVHGANSAAWVWERHFLPYFAGLGYECHALSLRGHGGSGDRLGLALHSLGDYVDDVFAVAQGLPKIPVLVGHSMGGMVVQQALRRRRYPAAVLLAPVPPHGLMGTILNVACNNPGLWLELLRAQWGGTTLPAPALRRALFSDGLPADQAEAYLRRFQAESPRVVLDLLGLDLPPSLPADDPAVPVFVLGAGEDGLVTREALEATARTYRTTPEVVPGLGHALMLDRKWADAASRVAGWLDRQAPGILH